MHVQDRAKTEAEELQNVHVMFEIRAVEDRSKSLKTGGYATRDVDFIIMTPRGGNLVVEKEIDDEILQRFPQSYERWKKGQTKPEEGTWLKTCPAFSPAECENLSRIGINTLEQLSVMNEGALNRAGMSARTLQRRAVAYLESAKNIGVTTRKVEDLQVENDSLKATVAEMQRAIQELQTDKPPRNKGGRPRKEPE
jgi:hypothetical protein